MDLLAKSLTERFGPGIADSNEVYSMQIGGSGCSVEIQYDPYNRRLKFFDLRPEDVRDSGVIASAFRSGRPNDLYSKIIVYAHPGHEGWDKLGLRHEATIRGFFGDGSAAELWTNYPLPLRGEDVRKEENDRVADIALDKKPNEPELPPGYTCTPATASDAGEIAALMRDTFKDYPTPIETERVAEAIRERTSHFRLVRNSEGELVACASAEMHHTRKSAELTDCATKPIERGKGLMSCILRALERDLASEFGIYDVYTIARSVEPGMNCSFAKLGFEYTGRLVNNCRMPEGFESMNVWCRNTREPAEVS
jgi:putative beta-lysine N-acetyltransferase